MTISLPKTLLERIDRLRRSDNRTRSNWVVTELDDITAAKLNLPKLFSEAGEAISAADAGGLSSGSTRVSHAALPTPSSDPRLNEPPAEQGKSKLPSPRVRSPRAAIHRLVEREKPKS